MTFPSVPTDTRELVVVIPPDAKHALITLLGKLSREELVAKGLNYNDCVLVDRFYHTLR